MKGGTRDMVGPARATNLAQGAVPTTGLTPRRHCSGLDSSLWRCGVVFDGSMPSLCHRKLLQQSSTNTESNIGLMSRRLAYTGENVLPTQCLSPSLLPHSFARLPPGFPSYGDEDWYPCLGQRTTEEEMLQMM